MMQHHATIVAVYLKNVVIVFMFSENAKVLSKLILGSLKRYKYRIFFAIFCALAMMLEKSVVPYLIRDLVDSIGLVVDRQSDSEVAPVYMIAMCIGAILIASELLYRGNSFTLAMIYPRFQSDVREKILQHVMRHKARFFIKNSVGDISSKIYDLGNNAYVIVQMTLEFLLPISLAILATIFLMFSVSRVLGAVFFIWVCVHLSISFLMLIRGNLDRISRHAKALNLLHGQIVDTLLNIMHVKNFDNYSAEIRNFTKYKTTEEQLNKTALLRVEVAKLALFASSITKMMCVFSVAIYQWRSGILSTGDIVFVIQADITAMLMLWWLTLDSMPLAKVIGRSLQAVSLLTSEENVDNTDGNTLVVSGGAIEFCDVNFAYDADKPLFVNLNIRIKEREKVAIIGMSGSGKTTLINLVLKNYTPQTGQIKIDGQDIEYVSLKSLYSNITVVPQNVMLFNRSILDNILYGSEDSTYEDAVIASEKACCHDFIMELPNKYHSIMNSQVSLSRGQEQRILIARAILKNAPIVIMDEATSALDNITEIKVRSAIANLISNKTALIIAHKLTTLSIVDKVLIMKEGAIEDFGTPDELKERNHVYRELWDSYFLD